jgi:predicted dehydrogenase
MELKEDRKSIVRWGIMGCAEIARKNIRAIRLSPFAELVAIASRNIEKAEHFALQNNMSPIKIYGSYEDLLADSSVDAVYIPLPTTLHLHWVKKAAIAKKHILIEKPVALSSIELDEMVSVCIENGVNFMDGVMFMHHKRLKSILHVLNDPIPRKVKKVHASFSFNGRSEEFMNGNIRTSAAGDPLGALGDLGWYCIRIGILAFSGFHSNFMGSENYDQLRDTHSQNSLPWKLVPTRFLIFRQSFDDSLIMSF